MAVRYSKITRQWRQWQLRNYKAGEKPLKDIAFPVLQVVGETSPQIPIVRCIKLTTCNNLNNCSLCLNFCLRTCFMAKSHPARTRFSPPPSVALITFLVSAPLSRGCLLLCFISFFSNLLSPFGCQWRLFYTARSWIFIKFYLNIILVF